ncbi:MAG: SPOR domain-containing protein [Glaciimonas sp.]|nr:SPOR domain-containing protein [Glaciimonas sp.]
MDFFSFFRKNKHQPSPEQIAYNSRSAENASAIIGGRKRKNPTNQASDVMDPVLPEKKRARRRLVGAVTLVLALVIILPMLLDSEPKRLPDDIAIQIPSLDKPTPAFASAMVISSMASVGNGLDQQEEIIDPASMAVSSTNQPASATALVAVSSVPLTPPLAISGDRTNATVPSATKITPDIKSEPKQLVKAKSENKSKAEARIKRKPKPEPKFIVTAEDKNGTSEAPDDSARAVAILNGQTKAIHSSNEKKSTKFVIQVAALVSQEKVDELQKKLKNAGIISYTQKIKTPLGERIRIRFGPFTSKEEAERARVTLAPLGLSSSLIPT